MRCLTIFCLLLFHSASAQPFYYELTESTRHHRGISTTKKLWSVMPAGKNQLSITLLGVMVDDNRDYPGIHFSTFSRNENNQTSMRTTTHISYLYLLNRPIIVTRAGTSFAADSAAYYNAYRFLQNNWNIQPDFINRLGNNSMSDIAGMARQSFFWLPDTVAFKTGVNWTETDHQTRYTMGPVDKRQFTVYAVSKNDSTVYTINRKDRRITGMHCIPLPDISNGMVYERILHVPEKAMTPPPDTAYFNMLATGSFWSNHLKNKQSVHAYIQQYEPLFGTDRFFLDAKLSALQKTADYTAYDKELLKTPIALLAGTYHLFNVVRSDALTEVTYDTVIAAFDDEQFDDYIQQNLANDLKEDAQKYIPRLQRIHATVAANRQVALTPLWLWFQADQHKTHTDSLATIAEQFIRMKDEVWNTGNAGRYALAVYKLLPGTPQATALLIHTQQQLTALYNDTLNKNRYAYKNLLAYSFYLMFKETAKTDSSKAIRYLEQAAFYSPKSQKEPAYISHYDRNFLGSRENYTNDYLSFLTAVGKKDAALQGYIDDFSASQGESFETLKAFYIKNYDETAFPAFFKKEVLGKLKEAPDFSLSNLSNDTVSLKDLAGKWTVIDFWGTWCGPCVSEMPELNKYHQTLQKKKNNIRFLSIACNDQRTAVQEFLSKNNYAIPVLMSDGQIQKHYQVPGYPAKYIITPDGRVLPTRFGSNWQALVEKLAAL